MKNIFIIIALIGAVLAGCDDDDFGVVDTLDSPSFNLTASKTELITGETVGITISVTDAPGRIDSIAVSATNDFGVIDIDEASLSAARGLTEGTINLNYTAPDDNIGTISVTVTLFDQQSFLINAQAAEPQSKSFTASVNLEVDYRFDAPTFTVALDSDSLISEATTPITIEITDVPGGGIDQVIVGATSGTVTLDEASLNAALGQTSATITGTYQMGNLSATGDVDISVTVVDRTQNRTSTEEESVFGICPADEDISGSYDVFAFGTLADGTVYDALNSSVEITQLNDGQFMINDISFGAYDEFYPAVAMPEGVLNVCGSTVTGNGDSDENDVEFTINGTLPAEGTLNEAIRITWSNEDGDTGTVFLTLQI